LLELTLLLLKRPSPFGNQLVDEAAVAGGGLELCLDPAQELVWALEHDGSALDPDRQLVALLEAELTADLGRDYDASVGSDSRASVRHRHDHCVIS
jgi:hypothetical protein